MYLEERVEKLEADLAAIKKLIAGSQALIDGCAVLNHNGSVTIAKIVTAVSQVTNVTRDEIRSRDRRDRYCRARHLVMWLTRRLTDLSCEAIGHDLDRDHGAVMHGVKVWTDRMSTSPADRETTMLLLSRLKTDPQTIKLAA